jgi:3-oxoacyl-[acyl-carrier protein] reductase
MVTGGGGGLGEVIARALAAAQMHVVVADVDGDAARRVANDLDGTAVTADLSQAVHVETVVAAAEGKVDVLVNCAGGWSPSGECFPASSVEDWDAVLTLNLRSPMHLLQQLRPALSRSHVGAAVSISSNAARDEGAYASPEYAVAKAGLIRLTTAVADWRERFGIRVSCVVPGWIGLPRAVEQLRAMPVGDRPALVPPADIANEVLRLVTDPASAGRVVLMDGGEPVRTLAGS